MVRTVLLFLSWTSVWSGFHSNYIIMYFKHCHGTEYSLWNVYYCLSGKCLVRRGQSSEMLHAVVSQPCLLHPSSGYASLKHQYISVGLHSTLSEKAVRFILSTTRNWNLTKYHVSGALKFTSCIEVRKWTYCRGQFWKLNFINTEVYHWSHFISVHILSTHFHKICFNIILC